MAVFKCKMCEANLEVSGNTTVIKCEYCGTTQTVPWAEGGASGNAAGFVGNLENLIKRGNLSIEDRKWDDAIKYFDRVLDINVEDPRAYIGKLLAENKVQSLDELWQSKSWNSVKSMDNYKKAYRFADDELKKRLDEYYIKWVYRAACAKAGSQRMSDVAEAVKLFTSITYYKDSAEQADRCREKIYNDAIRLMESAYSENDYLTAKSEFESVSNYLDANLKAAECAFKAGEAAARAREAAEEEKRRAELHKQQIMEQMKQEAIQRKQHLRKVRIIVEISILFAAILYFLLMFWLLPISRYNKAMKYYESGDYDKAIGFFSATNGYKDSESMLTESYYVNAVRCYKNRDYKKAMQNFKMTKGYKDSDSIVEKIVQYYSDIRENLPFYTISASSYSSVGVKNDGTVIITCPETFDGGKVSAWNNIVAVSAGTFHTVGLKSNGRVMAVGFEFDGRCDVSDWTDIVAVSAGDNHTIGLKSDGTVVAAGDNEHGQCDVSDWHDIVAIAAGGMYTMGVNSDGTVVCAGKNHPDLSEWNNIVSISTGYSDTVGLKNDGTVVAYGYGYSEAANWSDIVAVSAGSFHFVGLKSDGTVVATGDNKHGQCNVSNWTDIIAVAAGDEHTIGLKSDGTVIATEGTNYHNECNVYEWTDIKTTP